MYYFANSFKRAQLKSLKGMQDHLKSSCHTTVADATTARTHNVYKHFIADRSTSVEELNVYSNTEKFAERGIQPRST